MEILRLPDALAWEASQAPPIDPTLRHSFDCGEPSLNAFLARHARQADESNISRTWILLDKQNRRIAGYVSISSTSIEKNLVSGLKIKTLVNPIPAMLIGRLAVDSNCQKKQLGERLLTLAFSKAREVNEITAIQAIVVDTLNAKAEAFYAQYGFEKIGQTNKMLISTRDLFS